jgi:hypothetical protein
VRDSRYVDGQGKPLALPIDGDGPTFSALVREFSGDVPPRSILDELVHAGAVEALADGRIQLVTQDTAHLIATITHNVYEADSEPRFQRTVSYDNLPVEALPELRAMSAKDAQALLEKIDGWMAVHDRDTNPDIEGSGRKRVGIGIYYFEEDFEENGPS